MYTKENITIFCLEHDEAENAGLQKLENGIYVPQDQKSKEKVIEIPNSLEDS